MGDGRIAAIEAWVRREMASVRRPELRLAHGFSHVDRVRRWALRIAREEPGLDLAAVEAAALLHDVGLAHVDDRRRHAEVGAELAGAFLRARGFFGEAEIAAIEEAIRRHSSLAGVDRLGAVLRDADILDLLGAVGVMRAAVSKHDLPEYDPAHPLGETWGLDAAGFTRRFAAGLGAGPCLVDQLNFQLSCADNLLTPAAKRLGAPLAAYLRAYILQFAAETAPSDAAST